MPTTPFPASARELHAALFAHYSQGGGASAVVTVLVRLLVEVEALREALSHPDTPQAVRQCYREAYARVAVLSHNAAGLSGGMEKVLERFVPESVPGQSYASEMGMLERLGATAEQRREVGAEMELAQQFT